jgi:hypothetical protein
VNRLKIAVLPSGVEAIVLAVRLGGVLPLLWNRS